MHVEDRLKMFSAPQLAGNIFLRMLSMHKKLFCAFQHALQNF
jgi:hypothetical protein